MSSRRRILHTYGVSGLAIAHQAYSKAQDLNGPIGSMAKRVAIIVEFIEPLLYALQYQSLAILSFVDDCILAVENVVETVFPPSEYVFDKIYRCVQIVEILPGKFDDATNKVYTVIHRFPLLDWALIRVICWLNFWVSLLIETTKEKEIMVDKSCNECNVEEPATVEDREAFPPIAETPQAEEAERVDVTDMKSTYKEALEKHVQQSGIGEKETFEGGGNNENDESTESKDDILELFEAAWLTQPVKIWEGKSISSSDSYA